MTAVAFRRRPDPDMPFVDVPLPDAPTTTVLAAVCPWCEKPRRLDRVGYFIAHRSQWVRGWLPSGRLRIYVARDECPGAGERLGETKAANES